MRFVPSSSVRVQVMLWVFLAILLSWVVSSMFSYLMVRHEMLALRQEMQMRPDLYPFPLPAPQFHFWDLLLGPQEMFPHAPPPPRDAPMDDAIRPPFPPPRPGAGDGPPQPQLRDTRRWQGILIRAGSALLLALLTGLVLGQRFTRPLLALARGAQAYRAGDYRYRVPLDGENEFTQVAVVMHDMADQVAEHIAQVEDDAKRRRQLLADVAHELRSPVMTMRTMAGALAEGLAQEPERYTRAVSSLARTSDRMLHLVNDLLELAKLDLHELPLHREQVDLREVVSACLQTHALAAQQAGFTLHPLAPAAPLLAHIDPLRLTQVLDNLLDNAIQYAGTGAEIRVSLVDGNPARILVADTGRGIPAQHLPSIFEPFYRVDGARSPADNHSGLGLRIARRLIETHGGTLTLTSTEGDGTTATISLPRE